ncbi:division plane positioning ATPase MipZ [Lyticum sinuosum]|uniref:P-loop containing nucleoside triphosphate hydrolase n=1 Tax=Lyticum sinuosum TaxID=1332059 RepID=A0AAE5AHR5_9RICK|nr:division plane positioning ATPase MipZ [Lyticum sinuosum]MDZ5761448.1 P-loop containing nucleoside triphosphate hydrolase [Lyticum sinuosum]
MAKIIVFGNEKGGSGKSTICIHVITALCKLGFKVLAIDFDIYQHSLFNYIENRKITSELYNLNLEMPCLIPSLNISEEDVKNLIDKNSDYDFILIDTPGNHSSLNRIAHSYADYLVTPINPSYIDLEVIGYVDKKNSERIIPGVYSAMLFEQRIKRAARDGKRIDWIVVLNNMPATKNIRNSIQIKLYLNNFAKKMGFRLGSSLCDRVIYKELYSLGVTLYDRDSIKKLKSLKISPSLLAARQEIKSMLKSLQISEIISKLNIIEKY